MAKFQYMSDLHLEVMPGLRLDASHVRAPYLVLAGDIGSPGSEEYFQLLVNCATLYRGVYVVLGNHEGYGFPSWETAVQTAGEVIEKVRSSTDNPNVHLLYRSAVDMMQEGGGAVRVLGCTLWSRVTDEQRALVETMLMDYRKIGRFSIDDYLKLHTEDVAWLQSALEEARRCEVPCLVVTHHAPLVHGTSSPCHDNSPMESAFSTDLASLLKDYADVAPAWIHGHTHHCHCSRIMFDEEGMVTVASNPRGFPHENEGVFRLDVDPITFSVVPSKRAQVV